MTTDPLFNSLVPESWSGLTAGVGFQPEEIDVALARTELRWRPLPVSGTPIQFRLNQIDGCLRLDVWSGDTGLVPRAELESVLLAVERLLVAAAHGDVAGGRMPELIGLEPLAGTPDRILVDHCWVDVADVQRLVDDAVAPAVAHVFASAGGRPLVAYLAATDAVRTPEQAHARCMAVLARHPYGYHPAPLRHLPHRSVRPGRPHRLARTPGHRHRSRLNPLSRAGVPEQPPVPVRLADAADQDPPQADGPARHGALIEFVKVEQYAAG